jgi:hypothetical protein
MYGAYIQKVLTLGTVASGTATLFAAATNTRFHITQVNVTMNPAATGVARVIFYETTDGATNSAVILNPAASVPQAYSAVFNPGLSASAQNSRLAVALSGSDASAQIVVTGFRR